MNISLSSISAGAMTAAVSLGSSLQAIGASAATTAAGAASSAASALPSVATSGAQALPQSMNAGAATTARLAADIAAVEKPAKAIAQAAPRASMLVRTATFLSKALPVVTIGASALTGARIVHQEGVDGLVNTKDGRGAVLGALGGSLMLIPTPATQLAAAGVLGAVAVNHFGGMDGLGTKTSGVDPVPKA